MSIPSTHRVGLPPHWGFPYRATPEGGVDVSGRSVCTDAAFGETVEPCCCQCENRGYGALSKRRLMLPGTARIAIAPEGPLLVRVVHDDRRV